jgi:hypothetical protein
VTPESLSRIADAVELVVLDLGPERVPPVPAVPGEGEVCQVSAVDILKASGGLFPAEALFRPSVPARPSGGV